MVGTAYWILARTIISAEGINSLLAKAIGKDRKGSLSVLLYAVAIPLAFVNQWIAQALYVSVAVMWIVPDRCIEKFLADRES
jgi:uncharacterized membrane protein